MRKMHILKYSPTYFSQYRNHILGGFAGRLNNRDANLMELSVSSTHFVNKLFYALFVFSTNSLAIAIIHITRLTILKPK